MRYFTKRIDEITPDDYYSLSPYRRARADSCRQEHDRLLSIAAGVLLAEGLREYGICEQQAEYVLGVHSKPYLKDRDDLFFSISHSGDICLVAFSDREIGCDIEKIGNLHSSVAKRFFTSDEQRYIGDSTDSIEAFYRIWTMKESFIKATGEGLHRPLKSFNVLDIPDYAFTTITLDGYAISICEKEKHG